MQKQREKLEAEKEAILNNKNLIAEVKLTLRLWLSCLSVFWLVMLQAISNPCCQAVSVAVFISLSAAWLVLYR